MKSLLRNGRYIVGTQKYRPRRGHDFMYSSRYCTNDTTISSEDERSLLSSIYLHSNFPTEPVNLTRLFQMTEGSVTKDDVVASARVLQQEVPIRLARRVVELESLPSMMADHPSIQNLKKKLIGSFAILKDAPEVVDEASEREYMFLQRNVRDKHQDMYHLLVDALVSGGGKRGEEPSEVTAIIDGFYSSRISLRMLVDHHNAIKMQVEKGGAIPVTGIIDESLSPIDVIRSMISDVQSCCRSNFGIAPDIEVEGTNEFTFTYVKDHVERIMYAILLNASRATAKHFIDVHGSETAEVPPAVRVRVASDKFGCTVHVSDHGNSLVQYDEVEKLFKYSSTISHSVDGTTKKDPLAGDATGIAGYNYVFDESAAIRGFGLPVSRLYARYFGGDLQVVPISSCGNETFLHLKTLDE